MGDGMGFIFPGFDVISSKGGFVFGLILKDALDIEIIGVHGQNIFI